MNLSVSTNLFSFTGDPDKHLRMISEYGFTHLLWGQYGNSDFAYGRHELSAIKKMLKRYHLTFRTSMAAPMATKAGFRSSSISAKPGSS